MKKLYVVILFLIFFNVFIIMFNSFSLFPMSLEEGQNYSNADSSTAEGTWEDVSGSDFGDIFSIIFVDINSDPLNILGTILIIGGAAFIAWLTRSPAPFVVAVVANVFKNTYVNSMSVFEQFPINNYMMIAGMIGMIILFIVTCLEYLTHGET